jgi:hypothetical protein
MLVSTGGVYRSRDGKKVGPLRPFRDDKDSPHTDIMGRSAWFYVDGTGAFSKHGEWLTGGTDGPNDLVAEWEGHADIDGHVPRHKDERELTVGTATPLGTLLAEVRVRGADVAIDKAWVESAVGTMRLDMLAIATLGVFHSGRWRDLRSIIVAAALAEARA